ncbi:MAG: Imm32 family immunity protein [Bacteroidia bacterium]
MKSNQKLKWRIFFSANKAGLISLAKHLLLLSQDQVPIGHQIHLDEFNSLEKRSVGIIIQKI